MYVTGSSHEFAGGAKDIDAPDSDAPEILEATTEGSVVEKRYADAGPRHLEFVPLTKVHMLEQPRRQYDSRAIEALAYAMVTDWDKFEAATTLEEIEKYVDIYNPSLLNRVSPDYLPTYLEDHARLYGIPTPVLYTELDEATDINAGGHTRALAYEWLLKYKGFTKEHGRLLFNVRHNLSHAATLAIQIRENIKSNPPPEDLAFIIERIANDYENTHGEKPSHKYLSRHTGLSEGVISEGLAFTSLPREIQDYVGDPRSERKKKKNGQKFKHVIPYSVLTRLRPLQDAITQKYDRDNSDQPDYSIQARDAHVTSKLHKIASEVALYYIQGRKAEIIAKHITDAIKDAVSDLKVEQLDMIYVADAYNPKLRQERAEASLAQRAIDTLRLMAEQGRLKPDYADELREVYELFEQGGKKTDDQEAMF